MSNVKKIKLPDNTVVDIHDVRITGIDTVPTDDSTNVVTSDGIYNNRVGATTIPDQDIPEVVESAAEEVKMEYLNSMLAQAPKIVARNGNYEIEHPLVDYPGAECVLLRYAKKNGKLRPLEYRERWGKNGRKKKGFCVARNKSWSTQHGHPYFDFLMYANRVSLVSFFEGIGNTRSFGIVLRIPNPSYTGPQTEVKNALYKGAHEMLWSDIKRITVNTTSGHLSGIGLV